ncbi:alternate-type signal peptide domain-containing protein [Microbacterium sp. zg-YB36]|uniref:alternate-type signal peptide domain-containing protein n=1 Tax=Microbacterium sp. zg-YB36 TaxID=2969407 RepID=UPI00214CEF4B|nr:alternate-type signal peptide domain-containing protein [Microbacterium sp. zg-YB36]MDL5352060.1 alternate-type signal peptide domain-containing protein [Microbacterium sp. zg-YB36]
MNKTTKASIATAAGVLLLLGGGGTFATWNSSADAGAGATITAGNLIVENDEEKGVWTANGSTTAIDIGEYLIAPGDVLTYTKTMQVSAYGDSLTAVLGLTPGSIAPVTAVLPATLSPEQAAANLALAGFLTSSATLTLTPDPAETADPAEPADPAETEDPAEPVVPTITAKLDTVDNVNDFIVTPGSTGMSRNVTVTVTITFPAGTDGENNAAKTGMVSLSDLKVTLTQDGATPAPAPAPAA